MIILGIYLWLSYHWQEYTVFLLIPITGCFYWMFHLVFGLGLLLVRHQKPYGNHDTEAIADYDSDTLYGIYDYYSSDDNPMLFPRFQPNIYGRNNQYLRLENADGSLNHIAFLLDSNDYLPHTIQIGHYDSIHQDQIAWYQDVIDQVSDEQQETVRSFVFMCGIRRT